MKPSTNMLPFSSDSLTLERSSPASNLSMCIDNFLLLRTKGGVLPRVLPGAGTLVFFLYQSPVTVCDVHAGTEQEFSRSFVLCNRHRVLDFSAKEETELVVAVFRPGRLRYFMPFGFSALKDPITDAQQIWSGSLINSLIQKLAEAENIHEHAILLSNFFNEQLHIQSGEQLDRLMDKLYLTPTIQISELAKEGGWSLRHFERLFTSAYGVRPKFFARVARMQQVARQLALNPKAQVSHCAIDSGFFDQSHFIHELQKLSGLSSSELVRSMRERPHFYNPQAMKNYATLLEQAQETVGKR